MCRFALCEQFYGWLHAGHVFPGLGLLIVAFTVYRLVMRGRWITMLAILAGWAVIALVVLQMLPLNISRLPDLSPRR
jgi:hypothetical protein